jgi:predicted lipid carrier protein YhbT
MPKLPQFEVPRIVAGIVSRLPPQPPAFALTRALDFGVGRIVSPQAVAPLRGRSFMLTVRDLGLSVRFESTPSGFRVSRASRPPDLTISASLRDYIALWLREEDPDTLFFARRLTVEGDTDLGLTVKNLLDGIDWESALGRLLPPFLRPGAGH